MTFCPNFDTLQSTILVSKTFHRVFQTRPKSITRAVAGNIVGPALPQALRVIRFPYDDYDTLDGDLSMATACPEDDKSVITAEEVEKLEENCQVVAELEDIYSLMNKDRTSKTSVLTSEESWRFRRAMYRIMLYCNQFSGTRYTEEEIELNDEEILDKIRKQRTAVLNEYPTDELQQLHSVVQFLRSIFISLSTTDLDFIDSLLSTGPANALRAWQDRSYEVIQDDVEFTMFDDEDDAPLFEGYFSLPFENIWTERKVTPPKEDDPASKWILDQVNGANDTCSQCATPGGLKLYTEANWDRFPIILANLLKKNIKRNQSITQSFFTATAHLVASDALGPFIGDLFDFALKIKPEFDGWERTDSYCLTCLTRFLEEHLWIWFREERIKGGWTPPEDCWYGWNCRTQIHKRYHADTKNHLCAPIKGDPA
ncbi:hypothetical protein MVEN_01812600 [Mycena venus]|uniref:Aprataxin and PNK-like factor PBZ domain-containing protein n=1 Tax=Mycena venus TaxID=2733690 RepID=A0A8H6XKQ4_9AGAR|nr:hypothetical protein MVEN_01812600 [Mycena venus]